MMRCRASGMAVLLLVLTALAARGAALAAGVPQTTAASLHVTQAWVRWLPGTVPAGGYLTLVNDGDTAATLTGASSDAYGSVSLHQSREQDGVSSMTPVEAIVVPAHSRLALADQGYHLMLMQPTKSLKPGDTVVITLQFADGKTLPASFHLRSPDMLMSK